VQESGSGAISGRSALIAGEEIAADKKEREITMFVAAPLLLMLAAAPQSGDAVGAGRKAYSECLSKQLQPALDKKMSLGDFQSSLKAQCADKEAAFRAAIIADDKSSGMSEKDAQSDADDQISEYRDKMVGEFEDYSKS
jgi:hypothetical protein